MSSVFAENMDSNSAGFCGAPPPPPPPPPVPLSGQLPAIKIAQSPVSKQSKIRNSDCYEPPAAIQNAMMTKDKKPFTYTPGMGGKLDLSQIKSPRMARRVAKNANDEGIEGPVKSPLANEQPRPTSTSVNLFIQPQVAVPVFPINSSPAPNVNKIPINCVAAEKSEAKKPVVKIEPKTPTLVESPTSPTQVTLTKAPTPWLQNKNKQQDELPEWAKRSPSTSGDTVSPTFSSTSSSSFSYSPPPTNSPPIRPISQQPSKIVQPVSNERIIPLKIENRPSVFSQMNEPGNHHQFKNTTPHHQQRWGQQSVSPTPKTNSKPVASTPETYIVPIVVERSPQSVSRETINPPPPQTNRNEYNPSASQSEPIQSRSFKVLQMITDADNDQLNSEQLRKLQLTEDDKMLMNKFKEQVDGDVYLHQEEDPRYRGAAIPSRAFRYLQNITDSGEIPSNVNVPRAVNSALKRQNRNSRSFEETNLPPNEQQVLEPKKYTGSAIPSRSFRILQAMTSPSNESLAKQEIGQADFTYEVNSMMPLSNQQSIFIPSHLSNQPIFVIYYPITPQHFYHENNTFNNNNNNINNINSNSNNMSSTNSNNYNNNIQDAINASIINHFNNPLFYYENNNNNINNHCELTTNQNDSASNEIKSEAVNDYKSNNFTDINLNRIENGLKSSEMCSMNIVNEEDEGKKNKVDESRSLIENDDDHSEESDELTFDDDDSSVENQVVDNGNKESAKNELSCTSDSDSESYVAYSTGLNPQLNDKSEVIDENKENSTDCESYIEEEETRDTDINSNELKISSNANDLKVDLEIKLDNFKEDKKDIPQLEITVQDDLSTSNKPKKDELFVDKNFLNVENLKEDITDDEDSGVTSDMSRTIDTDSECQSKKLHTYKRTQTHSRLFKLLNQHDMKSINSNNQKYYPSSLIKNHCDRNNTGISKTIFKEQNQRNKIIIERKPNALCPRIKSTKNLPKILKNPIPFSAKYQNC